MAYAALSDSILSSKQLLLSVDASNDIPSNPANVTSLTQVYFIQHAAKRGGNSFVMKFVEF